MGKDFYSQPINRWIFFHNSENSSIGILYKTDIKKAIGIFIGYMPALSKWVMSFEEEPTLQPNYLAKYIKLIPKGKFYIYKEKLIQAIFDLLS